jgi:hypothetical protein
MLQGFTLGIKMRDGLKVVCLVYVRDAMYSSYTSILLVVVTHCCLHSGYQQAEIGRADTSRHPALDTRLRVCSHRW